MSTAGWNRFFFLLWLREYNFWLLWQISSHSCANLMCLELVNHPTENTSAYSLAYSLVRIYDMTSINLLSAWLGFANIDWEWKAYVLLAKYRETNAFTLFIGRNKWKLIFFPSFLKTSSCNKKLSNYWSASQNLQNCMASSKVFLKHKCWTASIC